MSLMWVNLYEKINTKEVVNWTTSLNEVGVSDGHVANASDNLSY